MIKKLITLFKSFFFLLEKENDKILNNIFTANGGAWNLEVIFKISDFATFLPSLNKIYNFLNIKTSIHYE